MTEENSISDICDRMNLPFKLKDLQLESLKAVVNGKDLFAVIHVPTGYGKTVLYSILSKLLWETKVKVRFPADCAYYIIREVNTFR